jgi:hypothetical protein
MYRARREWKLSTLDSCWRTISIAGAHRDDKRRFVARADEKLTALAELESTIVIAAN